MTNTEGTTDQTYRRTRLVGSIAAVLALLSLARALIVYRAEELGSSKVVLLGFLLVGWLVIIPVTLWVRDLLPRPARWQQISYKFQMVAGKRVFSPLIALAFFYLALTTWQRGDNEFDLLHPFGDPIERFLTNSVRQARGASGEASLTNLNRLSVTNWSDLIETNSSERQIVK